MSGADRNVKIWDDIYAAGRNLWYPYEVAVRIIHQLRGKGLLTGVILDHGCGSGNHLEFMVRLGLSVIGSEVSPSSLGVIKSRFNGAKLSAPEVTLFDPARPLEGQLPRFDHVFAWGSMHYNTKAKFLDDLGALIGLLPTGGRLILAIPSRHDVVATQSSRQADGSYRLSGDVSGQQGAIVTIPDDEQQLRQWCAGIAIDDCGSFGWTVQGVRSEFLFLHGSKEAAHVAR
jgi:SAM-dependent methyltransferase